MPWLSIDIGSSTVKAGIIAEDGTLLGLARRPVVLRHAGANEHEADPEDWYQAAAAACRELSALPAARGLRAFAVSGNGPTLVAADGMGRPVGPALSWMDRRARTEAERVSRLAGRPIDASFYLPKALWLLEHRPETAGADTRFLACPEYLLYRMTGEALTCLPSPGYAPYVWSDELIAGLGLPAERFPPTLPPGAAAGRLREAAAADFRLQPGLPAAMGFPDFLASLVGSGVVEPGVAGDRGGTSEALNLCATRPFEGRELLSLPHAVPGLWNVSGGLSTAGKALEWVARMGGWSGLGADSLFAEAQRSPPGARGLVFLPYLAGERAPLWDPDRRGAFVGMSLAHDRSDLARAACESLAYGLKLPLETARSAGFSATLVRASGAPARNDFLAALKAEVFGLPVECPLVEDAELVGDAAACAALLGEARGLAEASLSLVRITRRFEPDPRAGARYEEAYGRFLRVLEALGPVDRDAATATANAAAREGEMA